MLSTFLRKTINFTDSRQVNELSEFMRTSLLNFLEDKPIRPSSLALKFIVSMS